MNEAKAGIFKAAIASHQSVIDDFKKRIKDLMANDGNVNEEEYDNNEQAIRADRAREVDMINEQLEFANRELAILTRLSSEVGVCRRVAPGAVVQTDRGTFFVSASIEEFHADGKKYFGVSQDSPIYRAMQGKQPGETFKVGHEVYRIANVY